MVAVHVYNYLAVQVHYFIIQKIIPYSGKLSKEKTFTNWWRTRNSRRKLSWIAWRHQLGVGVAVDFHGENLHG